MNNSWFFVEFDFLDKKIDPFWYRSVAEMIQIAELSVVINTEAVTSYFLTSSPNFHL